MVAYEAAPLEASSYLFTASGIKLPVQRTYPGSNFVHYGEPANQARPEGLAFSIVKGFEYYSCNCICVV
jgi:hypothetical protein